MFFAGVDWADAHHDVAVVDEAGQLVGSKRVSHSPDGIAELRAFLLGIAGGPDQVPCFVETNHGLLVGALLEMSFPVYPVNPKTVDRHRRPSGAKTDHIDAYLLARTGRSDLADLRRLQPDNPLVQELKILTRDLQTLIQSQTRLLNQLRACLKAYFPVALNLFSNLEQPTTQAFLKAYPTLEAARAAPGQELAALLRRQRHPYPDKKAREILAKLRQPQLAADPVTTRAKSRLMLALLAQLASVMEQIEAYDQEIRRLFSVHPDSALFDSLPGAGERIAPRLLAEWGDDRDRYVFANSIQALAGTCPVTYQSGGYRKAHKRYACIKPFRDALHQFARQSALREPWAAAFYQRKRAEGKSHSMAVRALSNVWVRIIFAMWLKHEPYDASLFLAAKDAHARSTA